MKKAITIIIAIIRSKAIRNIVKELIDMIKKIDAEVKKAKQDNKITKQERKQITKVGVKEFIDVLEKTVELL